jgi:hypothetical protein
MSSFTNPSKLREQVATQKARQQLEKQAEEERLETENKKEDEGSVDSKQESTSVAEPEEYLSAWGKISRKELLRRYGDITQMVKSKGYFLPGYAVQPLELGGMNLKLRTLRQAEQRLVMFLSRKTLPSGATNVVPDEHAKWQLVFMLAEIGGETWDPLDIPQVSASDVFADETEERLKKFLNNPELQRRLKTVLEWPAQLYDIMIAHAYGIAAAFSFAIEDDMRNP